MISLSTKTLNSSTNLSSLVVGSENGFIKVFDSATHKPKQLTNIGTGLKITTLGRTSISNQTAIGSDDFNITIYNTALAKSVVKFAAHDDSITSINFCSQTNQIISAGMDCTYKFWDPQFRFAVSSYYDTEDCIISSDINRNGLYVCLDMTGMTVFRPVNHPNEYKIIKPDKKTFQDYHFIKFSSTNDYHYFISTSNMLKVYDIRNFKEFDNTDSQKGIIQIIDTSKQMLVNDGKSISCYSLENNMVSTMELIKNYSINNPTCMELTEDKNIFIGCQNGDMQYSMYRNYTFNEQDSD